MNQQRNNRLLLFLFEIMNTIFPVTASLGEIPYKILFKGIPSRVLCDSLPILNIWRFWTLSAKPEHTYFL